MFMLKTLALGTFKLSGILNSLSMASLRYLYNSLLQVVPEVSTKAASQSPLRPQTCPECRAELGPTHEAYSRIAVCDYCGYHFVWSASQRVAHLADAGSFRPINRPIQSVDFLGFDDEHPYTEKLITSQQQTGLRDAILTGHCRIGATETVLAVLDFHFMGGSMGSVVGEQITFAFEYATKHRLPLVTVVTSGGARLQEGIISLMQMPKTAAAFQRF